jgi:hypothetical protein
MKFIFCILAGVFAFNAVLYASDEEASVELLPRGRPFELTFADPREIKLGLQMDGSGQLFADVGNYFSILGYGPRDHSWSGQFGIEGAGYFEMRRENSRFPLQTADGLLGVYFEGNFGPWQGQLRYTHISAHLADGSTANDIVYSREFATLRAAYVPSFATQVYVGVSLLTNSTPALPPWTFQAGGSLFWEKLMLKVVPFIAADFKYRTESSYNPSLNVEIGVALNNPPEAYRSFRLFYAYYTGEDPRGQFYNQYYTSHSIGLEMQI